MSHRVASFRLMQAPGLSQALTPSPTNSAPLSVLCVSALSLTLSELYDLDKSIVG